MLDSWSRQPRSPLVAFQSLGIFVLSMTTPSSFSCINDYLAEDSGGNMCSICSVAECFLEKPSWCWNEQVCLVMKFQALWAVRRTGYCAIIMMIIIILFIERHIQQAIRGALQHGKAYIIRYLYFTFSVPLRRFYPPPCPWRCYKQQTEHTETSTGWPSGTFS